MKIIYDVKEREIIGSNKRLSAGESGYMSFNRLAELLKSSGEIHPSEELTYIVVTEQGISYRVR